MKSQLEQKSFSREDSRYMMNGDDILEFYIEVDPVSDTMSVEMGDMIKIEDMVVGGVERKTEGETNSAYRNGDEEYKNNVTVLFCDDESNNEKDLKSRIFKLRLPKRSATTALQKWVSEGNKIAISELRNIETNYVVRIDLMTKVFSVEAAERYFELLLLNAKIVETYTALLHCYVAAKLTERADSLFERINDSNIATNTLLYNKTMTLHMSVGLLEKLPVVIEEMNRKKVSLNLFTYNLWISSCAASMDIDSVRRILYEMSDDSNSSEAWVTYKQLANIYITTDNLVNMENNSLVEANGKATLREWITYDFLIHLFTGLQNKDIVNQIWKSLRMSSQKMTTRNFKCILSSYLMLGEMKETAEVLEEWKQSTTTIFDIHTCTTLLDTFSKVELTDKAELLRTLMMQKNCNPALALH
ncbi:hypothetical protein GIB67_039902 [Kingdonia uniflora]|uniref:Pentatricopeptide repeat-containing protein n=1 Tax=Kingdonia uniflora TaxID=39325 RepID=A0A7J7P3E5_9MAGN|nr:hypothetical protein GIB67_039902 [Kingdonia uniflora]